MTPRPGEPVDLWTGYAGGQPNDSTDVDTGSRERILDPSARYLHVRPDRRQRGR
ncbi:hypothetical protein [Streptomyces sp. 3N207]|uniref:hypothetical protein n=1 Tax=Streptomyces sp. 3N207 TaxID=3457417 RepID=UPI003FD45120